MGEIPSSSREQVEHAAASAFAAWGHGVGSFSGLRLELRLDGLMRLAAALDDRAEEFAHWHAAEIGVPVRTARRFAGALGDVVRGVVESAPTVLGTRLLATEERRVELRRLPWGPAALFTAWNAPAFLAASKLAYALAAGCPAILKPSEYAPATTGLLVEALQAADPGPGAVQVVCGGADIGAVLAADPRVRMINYTGGQAGGRAVASAAISRMAALQLELSASNPAIVLRGADLDAAAVELARGMAVLNGQWCEAPRRVFAPGRDHDRLAAAIIDELRRATIGHALDETTELGPLAHRDQFESVAAAVSRLSTAGDTIISHPKLPSRGFYLSPTVIAGLPMASVTEEIFGPVLSISPYDQVSDAVEAANSLEDGLAGYVFAGDRDEAFALASRLHAGEIRLGGTRALDLASGSRQSFWGTSGVGGHGHVTALEAHTGMRVIGEEDPALIL